MAYTFDGLNKRVILSTGTVTLSCTDLWSRYVDWLAIGDNSKYITAFRTVGRDESDIPLYLFINDIDGWAIVPQSSNHVLAVTDGVLKTESGSSGNPFVFPAGSFNIQIDRQVPGVAIGYSTTGETTGPTLAEIRAAIRLELAPELSLIDAPISSRATVTEIMEYEGP